MYWPWLFATILVGKPNRTSSVSIENPYACNLAISGSWFVVSKAFDRSINKVPAKSCLSRHNLHLSINDNKAYCVLNSFLYPQRKGERTFPI